MTEWQGASLENWYARKGFGVRVPVPPPDQEYRYATVAQWTERRTADAKVGGSSPLGRTSNSYQLSAISYQLSAISYQLRRKASGCQITCQVVS